MDPECEYESMEPSLDAGREASRRSGVIRVGAVVCFAWGVLAGVLGGGRPLRSEASALFGVDEGGSTAASSTVLVRSTGDDSGDGYVVPVLTLARAVEVARSGLASSGAAQTIDVGSGIFSASSLALGASDAGLTLRGAQDGSSVVSGGALVPESCWVRTSLAAAGDGAPIWACELQSAGPVLADRSYVDFRSLRVGDARAERARYPDASADYSDPTQFVYANSSVFVASNTWAITLAPAYAGGSELPDWLLAEHWAGARVVAWPSESWNNYEAVVAKPTASTLAALVKANYSVDQPWFEVRCPLATNETDSACDGYDGELKQGSRLYVFDALDALSLEGEWVRDAASDTLFYASADGPPADVYVPLGASVVDVLAGADGVAILDLTFVDGDYKSYGFQDGFSIDGRDVGIPDDGALRVRAAGDVLVSGCHFKSLAGGGILVTDSAARFQAIGNTFTNMGQSGVMLTGNVTTRPTAAFVAHNVMDGIGQILASAGGVYCCSCVDSVVHGNQVTRASRWGVAVRSQSDEDAHSFNNSVTHNRLSHLGLASKDFGGVSVIAYACSGETRTTIAFNRVTDVVGVYSDWDSNLDGPVLYAPYMSYGIYLDNYASGYNVSHNVVANTEDASFFFHDGRANTVVNNVFFNSSNVHSSAGAQINIQGVTNYSDDNVFARNIVAFPETPTKMLWYADSLLTTALARSDFNTYFLTGDADHYQYYYNNSDLTYLGNWTEWLKAGYDANSLLVDPKFRNADLLDLCLEDDSPAYSTGFAKIPESVCK